MAPLIELSEDEMTGLRATFGILHLLHHRSHNQHRRSSWYRHFSIFRRQLRRIIANLDPQHPEGLTEAQKSASRNEGQQSLNLCLDYWAKGLVYRWYAVFLQLVSDPQFFVLGIFLLGCLGRATRILDIMARRKAMMKPAPPVRPTVANHELEVICSMAETAMLHLGRRKSTEDLLELELGVPVARKSTKEMLELELGMPVASTIVETALRRSQSSGAKQLASSSTMKQSADGAHSSNSSTPPQRLKRIKERKREDGINNIVAGI